VFHLTPGVRAVFFDAVGTVLFPEPGAPVVYADTARRAGLDLPPDVIRDRFVEAYLREEARDATANWATSEPREAERWRVIVSDALAGVPDPEACFAHLFEHFAQPHAWRVPSDAATVFAALEARGLTLGMGSNYDARLLSVLAGFPELVPLCGRVVVSAAVGWRKPSPAFFAEVLRVAGCAGGEVLFVGDDLDNDYLGARAAGLRAVLLDPRGRHPDVPDRIASLSELLLS
jgi:putative hydrolase of the HAD superfamily